MKIKILTLFIFILFYMISSRANNIKIYDANFLENSILELKFSWENAWNLSPVSENHDAVWFFFKYSYDNINWIHLKINSTQNQNPDIPEIRVEGTEDETGIFVTPETNMQNTGIQIIKIIISTPLNLNNLILKAFAIEMVYIPEGSFWLGDNTSINSFKDGEQQTPFYISSENEITCGNKNGQLISSGTFQPGNPINPDYPKGFRGFYIMKYEISQHQYAEFLNCLSFQQQQSRVQTNPASTAGTPAMYTGLGYRNGIIVIQEGSWPNQPAKYGLNGNTQNPANMADDGGTRAMNWLNYPDLAAYLDWSGLRPLTEFEFEKAARGNIFPTDGEFAWGTPFVTDANTIILSGTSSETCIDTVANNSGLANHGYAGIEGPLRCGFRADSISEKLTVGASYYGVFELSGNVWEICISACMPGNLFSGKHGDGFIDIHGNANVEGWPDQSSLGTGYKGGAWNSGIYEIGSWRDLATSDRYYAGLSANNRRSTSGGRGGRSH